MISCLDTGDDHKEFPQITGVSKVKALVQIQISDRVNLGNMMKLVCSVSLCIL